jgi:hypothetical protein
MTAIAILQKMGKYPERYTTDVYEVVVRKFN